LGQKQNLHWLIFLHIYFHYLIINAVNVLMNFQV